MSSFGTFWGRRVICCPECFSIHFWAQVTPHFGTFWERYGVFFLSLGSRLLQSVVAAWHWFMATRLGCSATYANQKAALWSELSAVGSDWNDCCLCESCRLYGGRVNKVPDKLHWLIVLSSDLDQELSDGGDRTQAPIFTARPHSH